MDIEAERESRICQMHNTVWEAQRVFSSEVVIRKRAVHLVEAKNGYEDICIEEESTEGRKVMTEYYIDPVNSSKSSHFPVPILPSDIPVVLLWCYQIKKCLWCYTESIEAVPLDSIYYTRKANSRGNQIILVRGVKKSNRIVGGKSLCTHRVTILKESLTGDRAIYEIFKLY